MTEKEKAKKLYEGKTFYIINPDSTLSGPRDDIYYVARRYPFFKNRVEALFGMISGKKPFSFVQVINGQPYQVFTKDEIVVVKNGKQVA